MQFAFQLGGAVSLCISQALFLARLASEFDAGSANLLVHNSTRAGTSNVHGLIPSSASHGLRWAYQHAIRDVSVFLLVATGLACLSSLGFEHKNVRKVEKELETVEDYAGGQISLLNDHQMTDQPLPAPGSTSTAP